MSITDEFKEDIHALAEEITRDYVLGRAVDNIDDAFLQPDREIISECIRRLLSVIYPGFYRDRHYKVYSIKRMTSLLIEDVLYHLSKQVYLAFRIKHNDKTFSEEGAPLEDPEDALSEENTHKELHERSEKIVYDFLKQLPKIRGLLEEDLHAAYDGDPAASSIGEILLAYPGIYAISIYRLAHELSLLGVPLIPRVMTEIAHSRTGIDIHPDATIGHNFFIDHGTGIVVGSTTIIGNNVKIYQGVTLGALSTHGGQKLRSVKRHPTIEDDVTIYSNATILGGNTIIGKGSVIGGNTFITKSVKPNSRISVKTREQQIPEQPRNSAQESEECWYYVI